jgi:hypothetical protein
MTSRLQKFIGLRIATQRAMDLALGGTKMTRSFDSWLLPTLFACLLLVLAKSMAAERNDNIPSKTYTEPRGDEVVMFVQPEPVKAEAAKPCAKEDPDAIPEFSLKDPLGVEHKGASLYGSSGMLVMITVPNLTQYERQQRWEKWVAKQKWPEQNAPQRVLIEDLSQQEMFKERARALMKDKFEPKGDLMLLVDEDGAVRRKLGVNVNETVILLIDSNGHIVHCESDDVEPDRVSAQRLVSHVRQLAENNIKSTVTAGKAVTMAR